MTLEADSTSMSFEAVESRQDLLQLLLDPALLVGSLLLLLHRIHSTKLSDGKINADWLRFGSNHRKALLDVDAS